MFKNIIFSSPSSYSTYHDNTHVACPPAPIDVLKFDRLKREEQSCKVQKEQNSSAAAVLSLFGPRAFRLTTSFSSNAPDDAGSQLMSNGSSSNINKAEDNEESSIIPIGWGSRLRYHLEAYGESQIIIQENIMVDGICVPLLIIHREQQEQEQRNECELKNKMDSLIMKDFTLWRILGEGSEEHGEDDGRSNNKANNTKDYNFEFAGNAFNEWGSEEAAGNNVSERNEEIYKSKSKTVITNEEKQKEDQNRREMKEKKTKKLIFLKNKSNMCFTHMKPLFATTTGTVGDDVLNFKIKLLLGNPIEDDVPINQDLNIFSLRLSGWKVEIVEESEFIEAEASRDDLNKLLSRLVVVDIENRKKINKEKKRRK